MKRNHRFRDLTGAVFGRLTVLEFAEIKKGKSYWRCRCECGAERRVTASSLGCGETTSCGCFKRDQSRAMFTTHGKSGSRVLAAWSNMIRRCENPRCRSYPDYGGRGIQVCESWKNFDAFYADMGDPPAGLTLERVDNNQGYSPENCIWASRSIQTRNTRRNRVLTHNGKTQCLQDWANELGLGYETIWYRLDRGWSVARALTV